MRYEETGEVKKRMSARRMKGRDGPDWVYGLIVKRICGTDKLETLVWHVGEDAVE